MKDKAECPPQDAAAQQALHAAVMRGATRPRAVAARWRRTSDPRVLRRLLTRRPAKLVGTTGRGGSQRHPVNQNIHLGTARDTRVVSASGRRVAGVPSPVAFSRLRRAADIGAGSARTRPRPVRSDAHGGETGGPATSARRSLVAPRGHLERRSDRVQPGQLSQGQFGFAQLGRHHHRVAMKSNWPRCWCRTKRLIVKDRNVIWPQRPSSTEMKRSWPGRHPMQPSQPAKEGACAAPVPEPAARTPPRPWPVRQRTCTTPKYQIDDRRRLAVHAPAVHLACQPRSWSAWCRPFKLMLDEMSNRRAAADIARTSRWRFRELESSGRAVAVQAGAAAAPIRPIRAPGSAPRGLHAVGDAPAEVVLGPRLAILQSGLDDELVARSVIGRMMSSMPQVAESANKARRSRGLQHDQRGSHLAAVTTDVPSLPTAMPCWPGWPSSWLRPTASRWRATPVR